MATYVIKVWVGEFATLAIYNASYLKLPTQKRITFEVSSNGLPINEAAINLNNEIFITDEYGYVNALLYDNLGVLSYEITKEGYEMHTASFDVALTDTIRVNLSPTTAVESKRIAKVVMYTNPANDYINVSSTKPVSLVLFDVTGKKIKSIIDIANIHTIPMSDLATGVHYLSIYDGMQYQTLKIFKEK